MTDDAGEKKIFVDEDWKSQVQAEKEKAAEQYQAEAAKGAEAAAEASDSDEPPMPPASFATLLSTLATQSMIALGQIADPMSGEPAPNMDLARYFIDTLGVIQEKTQGNLTDEEEKGLEDLLHQLRMAFVALQQQAGGK